MNNLIDELENLSVRLEFHLNATYALMYVDNQALLDSNSGDIDGYWLTSTALIKELKTIHRNLIEAHKTAQNS